MFGAIEVTNQIGSDGASSFTAEDRELLEFFALLIAPGVYQSYRKNEEDVMKLVHEGLNRIKKEAAQNEHSQSGKKSGEWKVRAKKILYIARCTAFFPQGVILLVHDFPILLIQLLHDSL